MLATLNPLELEATYALPEAQLDRFFCKLLVKYPKLTELESRIPLNMNVLSRGPIPNVLSLRDVLRQWLEEDDQVERLEHVESDMVADRERVGYRFTVSNPDGRHVVEQQAYLAERDGQICWMRVVCSGFRPA